ncbi:MULTISPECIES: hypothetical protein [Streptomyces]|uniref:hypothetical protein n=1 Tax=Streptomyces TaxID=1883 RepID=UPI0018E020B9|nr:MULTISPECIES: hypothetical protein [Streptomyces]MCZ4102469.1 hypothetical protein [Streptomyces sp. H39-C1]
MGVHSCTASVPLPSDNDAFDFTADLDVTWQVIQPDQFATSRERDMPALLAGRLDELDAPARAQALRGAVGPGDSRLGLVRLQSSRQDFGLRWAALMYSARAVA